VHIDPSSSIGAAAQLSQFLTGFITMPDPVEPATTREYHDLEDRENRINGIQGSPCLFVTLFHQPMRMVH
jgi:hypothetical protein